MIPRTHIVSRGFCRGAVIAAVCLATPLAPTGCHRDIPGGAGGGIHRGDAVAPGTGAGGTDGGGTVTPAGHSAEGAIEGTVTLTGTLPQPVAVDIDAPTAHRPGCADAARFYGLPFGMSQPGPLEAALVTADAHLTAPLPPRRRVVTFGDCSIMPRLMVMSLGDHLILHADTREFHFPKVEGMGATIAQMLQPTEDQEKVPPHPGRYIIHSVNYPNWMQTPLIVLPNPFYGQSDDHGHYRVEHVPVGQVTVHAWYPGARPVDITVSVRAGQVTHQDFSLSAIPLAPDAGVAPAVPTDAGPIPP